MQTLLSDVQRWAANGRSRDDLYTSEQLNRAKDFTRLNEVSQDVWDFIEAGIVFQAEQRVASSITPTIRHDMRGFLDTVTGFSRIILKGIHGPLAPEHARDVMAIHEGGRRLRDFLDVMVENAKLEVGEVTIEVEAIDLIELVEQTMEKVKQGRAQHSLPTEVVVAAQSNLPEVEGDRYHTRLALQCLFEVVAAQDTPMSIVDVTQDTDRIQISCSDCMLREDEIDEIQGAAYKVFPHPLQLARRLIQKQGGGFSIQPEAGDGYEISLGFPLQV
jgi:hypothetical protein